MTVDATWSPPATEDRRSKGRRHLPGVAGRVCWSFSPRQSPALLSLSSKVTLNLRGTRPSVPGPDSRASGFMLRSPPVSHRAGSYAQEPTCVPQGRVVWPPVRHWPALSSFLPVGLLILQLGTATVTSGIVRAERLSQGTSPCWVYLEAGDWALAVKSATQLCECSPRNVPHMAHKFLC